jgi:O-antigen ligase
MDGLHPLFLDAALDSAHNEYLQYLLTLGLVGLGAYLGLLGTLFLRAWRRGGGTALNRAFLLGGVSYAAQAFVNIAQPASTPLFFGVLGMLAGSLLSSDTAEGTDKESGPAPLDKPALGKF